MVALGFRIRSNHVKFGLLEWLPVTVAAKNETMLLFMCNLYL